MIKNKQKQCIMPKIGFGTFGRNGAKGIDSILNALEVGYRHVDTAQTYNTEVEVGEAISSSKINREEIFVTTKISTDNFGIGELIPSLEASLDALKMEHVNLTLIHWPAPNNEVPLEQYLEQIALAKQIGLTKNIGVSNFNIALLEKAKFILGKEEIFTNQIELNPWLQNKKLTNYCKKNGVIITCYRPIADGKLNEDTTLIDIANRYDSSPSQIALAFEFMSGFCAIPTSKSHSRIEENYKSLNIELDLNDFEKIKKLDRNFRSINPDWGPKWDI